MASSRNQNLETESESSEEEIEVPKPQPSTSAAGARKGNLRASNSAKLPIQIRTLEGRTHKIEAQTDWTVQRLKQEFEEWRGEGTARSCILFYRGKRLTDTERLSAYRMEPDSVIQANFRSTGGLEMEILRLLLAKTFYSS